MVREPLPDLGWVDEWVANVRPYVFVRPEDNLLIKRPNQAQKLNPQGAAILAALLAGTSAANLVHSLRRHPQRLRDVASFLWEVRRYLAGELDERCHTSAVEVEPFNRRFSELPILSEIALTYRCNLRCVFCYAGCGCTTGTTSDEMSTTEVREALRRLFEEGRVPSVSFTGGEPTLRPDLCELIAHAKALGMRVNLISNGTLVDAEMAARLAGAGLDSAQVSIEAPRAAVHDRITGVPGSFAQSAAAVEHLAARGIRVHTNTTLNRLNLIDAPGLPSFVADVLGRPRFSMNLVIPTGSATDELVVYYHEVGEVLTEIQRQCERFGVELMWYSPTPMCVFNPIAHGLGNHGCSACDSLISVAPNGDVLPCASYDDPVGNLLTTGVREVWDSPRARAYRDKALAHPECRDCDDFDICHGACPLYWRRMGFGELTRARGFAACEARPTVAAQGAPVRSDGGDRHVPGF